MAYSLRYYYENTLKDGKVVRLEIHEKDGKKPAIPIGEVVQKLSLHIQGAEDDIVAPIAITSLTMTFVDAPDLPEAATHKCGDWIEFYTPDSTYWKVIVLAKDVGSSSFRAIWGGYVTPDSYEETLTYRGSVTIVARDNIGHLQDFDFNGAETHACTISFRELIESAWEKIESPMSLVFHDNWLVTNGQSAIYTRMNVAVFEEKSWHEVLESALYAYGAVMRYVGNNQVKVCPIRYIPSFGGTNLLLEPTFVTGATRMLTPSVKKVEEYVSYELVADEQPLVSLGDYSDETHFLDVENEIKGYALWNTNKGGGWYSTKEKAIYFNPYNHSYESKNNEDIDAIRREMYLVANVGASNIAEYSRYIVAKNLTMKLTFGRGLARYPYVDSTGKPMGGYYLVPRAGKVTRAQYSITVTQNGITSYLDEKGDWQTHGVYTEVKEEGGITEISRTIDLSAFSGMIILNITISGIVSPFTYVQIKSLSFGLPEEESYCESNRVTTEYNEINNVVISRDPVVAPAFDYVFWPSVIKNGIFSVDGEIFQPTKYWRWPDDATSKPRQMAEYNHLQILCYYLRPNNVLEGTIVNADITRHACIWKWKGSEHLLVGGTYDFLSGYIEGAILRQFARYEEQVYVRVSKSAAFARQTGEVLNVNILCWNMIEWELSGDPYWITPSKRSGKGEATIQLTIANNNTGSVRVATIRIGNALLTITQKDRLGDFGVDFSLDYL